MAPQKRNTLRNIWRFKVYTTERTGDKATLLPSSYRVDKRYLTHSDESIEMNLMPPWDHFIIANAILMQVK